MEPDTDPLQLLLDDSEEFPTTITVPSLGFCGLVDQKLKSWGLKPESGSPTLLRSLPTITFLLERSWFQDLFLYRTNIYLARTCIRHGDRSLVLVERHFWVSGYV